MSLRDGYLYISCPQDTDFQDRTVQKSLRAMLIKALRYEAKHVIPSRLNELAELHGFTFTELRIKNIRSRWGSCSSKKNINISLYIMLLQQELIDYVLLHELCHTVEMNHGKRFWALMNKVTDGKAQSYRKRVKEATPLASALIA
jgi:predicted metal-dependent hydrolase